MSIQSSLKTQIDAISFGIVQFTPQQLASYFEKYVQFGSKRYTLSKDALTVYAIPDFDFEGKAKINTIDIDGLKMPKNLIDHLACGTKFLDAVLYLNLQPNDRPIGIAHDAPAVKGAIKGIALYNDHTIIAKYMFFYYFYVITRARAPEAARGSDVQPVPKFLNTVLSITATPGAVADYIASFPLTELDPAWVRYISIQGLSQEALSRFGLGVAGYRLAGPFKIKNPDAPDIETFKNAIAVAKSFGTSPADWDFHPATRHPDVLTKYGNINKNLGNLILKVYKKETIQKMVDTRILYEYPKEDFNHTNYEIWDIEKVYSTSAPIFPSVTMRQ